jgi:segregation and condensation protein B
VNPTDDSMPDGTEDPLFEASVDGDSASGAELAAVDDSDPDDLVPLAEEPASIPVVAAEPVDPAELQAALEAILFVVEAPVSLASLAAAVQQPVDTVATAVEALRAGYDERRAGVELRQIAGGVRIYTRPAYASQVEMFLQDGQRSRLSQAALETLAVIAYRQPVTRARVSAIRGVNVDGVVRTLSTRGLVVEVGSDPDTGGGLVRTTDLFLEKMGLQSLDELPSLAPLLPELDGFESDEL